MEHMTHDNRLSLRASWDESIPFLSLVICAAEPVPRIGRGCPYRRAWAAQPSRDGLSNGAHEG